MIKYVTIKPFFFQNECSLTDMNGLSSRESFRGHYGTSGDKMVCF